MSELQQYYNTFNTLAGGGHYCQGDCCPGWFLSDVDTWHECPCNREKGYPHPEEDEPVRYIVSIPLGCRGDWVISVNHRLDMAKRAARQLRDSNAPGVRLRRICGSQLIEQAEIMEMRYEDWRTD